MPRMRPLTCLIILTGALMLLSHYLFAMSTQLHSASRIVPPTLHEPGGTNRAAKHALRAEETEDEDEAVEEEEEEGETSATVPVKAKAAVDEKESDQPAGTAAASSLPSLASMESAAATFRDPYPTAGTELACVPPKVARPTRPLDYIVPPSATEWPQNCDVGDRKDLCAVVKKTAIERELLVAVCNSGIINQLEKWVEANRRAKISNIMIIAIDNQLPQWLESKGVAFWKRTTSAAGSHKISAQKFGYVKEFLSIGCSVLMSDIDVVYIQNPFLSLHKDSDIEGTTDGWDDGSAYGWTEKLDDPSMGATGRFRPAMRITAWNSGLWYARATHASLRMMDILKYRMETEDTWDQSAFGEEMSRPARDSHLAGGITKRALNHWCFANSKTIFRRVRTEPRFAEHKPVVVHANYHQPKPPRMAAVYDRWHLGQTDALNRPDPSEQGFTVPAPVLEKDFLHMINDGFVSGANTHDAAIASSPAEGGCSPKKSKHGLSITLHTRPLAPCAPTDGVCRAALAVAVRPAGAKTGPPELLLVVVPDTEHLGEVRLLLTSAKRSGIANLLLIVGDEATHEKIGEDAPPLALSSGGGGATYVSAELKAASGGARDVAVARYRLLSRLLSQGFGVLVAAPTTVFLSNPFQALYRDADVEAMSSGWDDGSAYGYNHVLDDPSMGFTRYCHGSRIVAYEPGFLYASPTNEAVALMARMVVQLLGADSTGGQTRAKLAADASAQQVIEAERLAFLHELWLPSHHEYASVGAVLRVMNYLCFANSKTVFRTLRANPGMKPVAVQINYHADAESRMRAVLAAYLDDKFMELRQMPLADSTKASGGDVEELPCTRGSEVGGEGELAEQLIHNSPYAWGGVGDMSFKEGGILETPWGQGKWGLHSQTAIFADFVGSKHNVRMIEGGMGVSTRCGDSNVVLVRAKIATDCH